jgi:hypothetical protein
MWDPDTLDESLFDRDYAQHAYPPAPLASAHEPVGNLA